MGEKASRAGGPPPAGKPPLRPIVFFVQKLICKGHASTRPTRRGPDVRRGDRYERSPSLPSLQTGRAPAKEGRADKGNGRPAAQACSGSLRAWRAVSSFLHSEKSAGRALLEAVTGPGRM